MAISRREKFLTKRGAERGEEIEALRETVRICAVAIRELPANSITDAEIKRVASERIAMHKPL